MVRTQGISSEVGVGCSTIPWTMAKLVYTVLATYLRRDQAMKGLRDHRTHPKFIRKQNMEQAQ
jgi:hypothetical protein